MNVVVQTINALGPDEHVITINELAQKVLKVLNSNLEPLHVNPRPQSKD